LLIQSGFAFFAVTNHGTRFNVVFGTTLVVGLLLVGCRCL
jgi:hypothetical protein